MIDRGAMETGTRVKGTKSASSASVRDEPGRSPRADGWGGICSCGVARGSREVVRGGRCGSALAGVGTVDTGLTGKAGACSSRLCGCCWYCGNDCLRGGGWVTASKLKGRRDSSSDSGVSGDCGCLKEAWMVLARVGAWAAPVCTFSIFWGLGVGLGVVFSVGGAIVEVGLGLYKLHN